MGTKEGFKQFMAIYAAQYFSFIALRALQASAPYALLFADVVYLHLGYVEHP